MNIENNLNSELLNMNSLRSSGSTLTSRITSLENISTSIKINDIATENRKSDKSVSLYKFFIENDNNMIMFLQVCGFTFYKYPGQSLLLYITIELWVLISFIFAIIGFSNLMRANHELFQQAKEANAAGVVEDEIPTWFLTIFLLGSCITVIIQIISIIYSLYHSRIQLYKANHITTKIVKDACIRDTLKFFTITQILAVASLILYTTRGSNFGQNIDKLYINFGIGFFNIVLTSYLSVVLFFMLLTTSQIQEVQKSLLLEAQNRVLSLENYKYVRSEIISNIYTSQSASSSIISVAALNMLVYFLCFYSIFTEANKNLLPSLRFEPSDIVAYSGVLMKEVIFFVYVLYRSSNINDIQDELINRLVDNEWEGDVNVKRISLVLYITNNPISFELLGVRTRKRNVLVSFLAFLSLTTFYIGIKVYYFYKLLSR